MSGARYKVATRPATVGITWLDMFQPGTRSSLGVESRVRVVADVAGALVQLHDNKGIPGLHRRHGRVTPRHVLVGVDGTASLFTSKEPFGGLLPPQPDLGYLAPEILSQSGRADARSDVFSLGVLLWEALDNGRLFPHRRPEAINRLISRASLPDPRVDQEWAHPLKAVALKALQRDPDQRYPDATSFWLALREHLPAPEESRAALGRRAQRALRLELTADVRDQPPYLSPSGVLSGTSLPPPSSAAEPNGGGFADGTPSQRYSMRPEAASWDSPASSSSPPAHSLVAPRTGARSATASTAPSEAPRAEARQAATPNRAPSSSRAVEVAPKQPRTSDRIARPSVEIDSTPDAAASARNTLPSPMPPADAEPGSGLIFDSSEAPVSTLRVSLPPDLVDSSLPYYLSSHAPARPFPWGMLSFAALVFFGVGAAVAFGAVTAMRATQPINSVASPTPAVTAVAPTATVAPTVAVAPQAPVAPPVAQGPGAGQPTRSAEGDRPQRSRATSTRAEPHPRRKHARSRARRAKVSPPPAKRPSRSTSEPGDEPLPFTTQPY